MPVIDVEFGKMQSDINYLKEDSEELKSDVREMKKDLAEIKQTLHTVGGMWRILVIFGTFCAAIGSFIGNIFPTIKSWLH